MLTLLLPMSSATPIDAEELPITVDASVVDGHGHAFPPNRAGVLACPAIGWSVPCTALLVGVDDDGDGHVELSVQADVLYRVNGFVTDTGWRDPGFVAADGTEFHFSPLVELRGSEIDGATFVIERPTGASGRPARGTTEVAITIVDGSGKPFPTGTAGVMACTTSSCDPMIVGSADEDGVARITLASKLEYRVTALVRDTGWACGGWVSPTGNVFHFSEAVVRNGAGFHRPTTLTIVEPICI
jgi:hypothetical protein